MAAVALGPLLFYLIAPFGVGCVLQWRTTGSPGFRGLGGQPRSAE